MKNKILKTLIISASLTTLMSSVSFAAGWKQDAKGWWYQNEDGSFPKSTWQWIDSNNDGFLECYGFNFEGYLYVNMTTPDGYMVDKNGAWTTGNTPYVKKVIDIPKSQNTSYSENLNNNTYSIRDDEKKFDRWRLNHGKEINKRGGRILAAD